MIDNIKGYLCKRTDINFLERTYYKYLIDRENYELQDEEDYVIMYNEVFNIVYSKVDKRVIELDVYSKASNCINYSEMAEYYKKEVIKKWVE